MAAHAENLIQALKQTNLQQPITVSKKNITNPSNNSPHVNNTTPHYQDNNSHAIHLSLPDAIAIALHKNPNIDKAYLQRIEDRFTLKVAKGQFEIQPKLEGKFGSTLKKPFGNQQISSITPAVDLKTPFGTDVNFSWDNNFSKRFSSSTKTLTITQPLLQGLGADVNEIDLKNAYDQEILNKLTLKNTIIDSVTTVISGYRALQQDEMNLVNNQRALRIAEQTVRNTEKKIKAGTIARSNIYQYQSQVANNQITIQTALNLLQQDKISLANDIGVDPNTDIVVPTTVYTPHVIPNISLSEKLAMANDKTYLSDIIALRKNKRALIKAHDAARWKLDLTATAIRTSYGHNNNAPTGMQIATNNNTVIDPSDDTVGLELTVPLGQQRLTNQQAIINAKISYQESVIDLKNDKRKLLNNVKQKIATINIDLKKLQLAKQAVSLQQQTVDIANKKLNAGLTSGFELTTEQENLRQSKQSLIQAEIAYLNDLASFDQTVGTTLNTWKIKVHY